MNYKAITIEWKDADKGTFRAKFATFNVVDRDGDVTFPGAFPEGKEVPMGSYGHGSMIVPGRGMAGLPTGKGVIRTTNDAAYYDGEFFLDTTPGLDAYRTVRRMGALQEWSYGYDVVDATFNQQDLAPFKGAARGLKALDPFEVAPVLRGSGTDTATVGIKGASGATDLPLYERGAAWDASAAEQTVRRWASSNGSGDSDTMDWAKYGKAFFWYDSAAREQFGSYKLGFAEVTGGQLKAVPRGIFAVAAVLQGSRGGVDIPAGDRDAIRTRVAGYYAKMQREFDDQSITPPWDDGGKAFTLRTQIERALIEVDALRIHAGNRAEHRAKVGRSLSEANRKALGSLIQTLTEAAAGLRALLDEADGGDGKASPAVQDLFVKYQATKARLDEVFAQEYARYAKQTGTGT